MNGQLRQNGTTADFLFPLDVLIHYIAQVMTLEPGDLIATGTPVGVGPLQPGDSVQVTVEGVGTLKKSGGEHRVEAPVVAALPLPTVLPQAGYPHR